MSNNNYRAYNLGNYYLSSIQQGIQAAHSQVAMILKSFCSGSTSDDFQACLEWADEPTTICLNGGNAQSLDTVVMMLESDDHRFCWADFREDEQSLNYALTNVCVLLPEIAYNARESLLGTTYVYYVEDERKTVRPSTLREFFEIFAGSLCDCSHLRKTWYEYAESYGRDSKDVFTATEADIIDTIAACRLAS